MTLSASPVNVAPPPNYAKLPAEGVRALPKKPRTDSTTFMVNSLASNIRACGEHYDCSAELAALVDIATYRNAEAETASRQAEQHLLNLFAEPQLASGRQRQIIDRLFESEAILMRGTGPNIDKFALPASLKHLMTQYVRRQMALEKADYATEDTPTEMAGLAIGEVHLEEMEASLAEAAKLDEDVSGPREVTTDEMLASFATVSDTCPHVINLSDGVKAEAAKMQLGLLLECVPKSGFAMAPLLVDGHFMLIVAEKSRAPGNCYALTIANTHLPLDEADVRTFSKTGPVDRELLIKLKGAAADRFAEKLAKKSLLPAFDKRVDQVEVVSNDLQRYAANSCGPLVYMLAKNLAKENPRGPKIGEMIQRESNAWRKLNARQQNDRIMTLRAEIFGRMVEWQRAARPEMDRFIESHTLRSRPDAQI